MENYVLIDSVNLNGNKVKLSLQPDIEGGNYFTIILGRNGAGKSRLLERICAGFFLNNALPFSLYGELVQLPVGSYFMDRDLFRIYSEDELSSSTTNFEEINLDLRYFYNGDSNVIKFEAAEPYANTYFYKNQKSHTKLICISNSLFDRFLSNDEVSYFLTRYNYSGFKNMTISEDVIGDIDFKRRGGKIGCDVFSKVMISSFLTSRQKLEKTLDFIERFGFDRNIKLSINFHVNLKSCKIDENSIRFSGSVFDAIPGFPFMDGVQKESLLNILNDFIEDIKLLDKLLAEQSERRFYTKLEDVFFQYTNRDGVFSINMPSFEIFEEGIAEKITQLSKYSVVKISSATFSKDGVLVNSNNMSSGEINTLLMLFKINSEIEDNSLILIDEPEISMHPAWQSEIIPSIERCFSEYKGCHFIAATHSPQVVSSIPQQNSSVVLLGDEQMILSGGSVHGQSSDFQLFYTLNYIGVSNEYVKRRSLTIIAKIDSSVDLNDDDYSFIMNAEKLLDTMCDDEAKLAFLQASALVNVVRR
ncbi:AAA family ATPase [Klebsiella oxytoca]|uniref:AAA family ATPase n=1 Tax=Klebsiella oxytoca TaxID=571 RepID=UPI00301CB8F9